MGQSNLVNIELIRNTRLKKKISTERMSKLMGYKGDNAYFRKENGDRNFSIEDIVKISSILELPIQKIFFNNKITVKVTKGQAI